MHVQNNVYYCNFQVFKMVSEVFTPSDITIHVAVCRVPDIVPRHKIRKPTRPPDHIVGNLQSWPTPHVCGQIFLWQLDVHAV